MKYSKKSKARKPLARGLGHRDFLSLKGYLEALNKKEQQALYDSMRQSRYERQGLGRELAFSGLVFRAPDTIEESLSLIADVAFILDFFLNRSGDYNLFMLLSKNPTHFWQTIAKHVYMPAKESDELIPLSALRVGDASIIIEALAVFADGLERIDVPQKYLYYAQGVSREAVQKLALDMDQLVISLSPISDPNELLGNLLGRTFSAENLIKTFVKGLGADR